MDLDQQNNEKTMDGKYMPMTSLTSGLFQEVADGVYAQTIQIVNVAYVRTETGFVLIDTGMPESRDHIFSAIVENFGHGMIPEAIILTHGHFDHIGNIEDLLKIWDIPVYAHTLEIPYLTGKKNYPEPDGSVEGGMIAKMSPLFPNEGINISGKIHVLPEDGSIPGLPEWKWIHTPGHSEGHVSLFREKDGTLIAGDAFVTVRQDSLYKVLVQDQEVNGPPRYLTTDWQKAKESVLTLAELNPQVAITGHGLPMEGKELQDGLQKLASDFDSIAVPDHGRYI